MITAEITQLELELATAVTVSFHAVALSRYCMCPDSDPNCVIKSSNSVNAGDESGVHERSFVDVAIASTVQAPALVIVGVVTVAVPLDALSASATGDEVFIAVSRTCTADL